MRTIAVILILLLSVLLLRRRKRRRDARRARETAALQRQDGRHLPARNGGAMPQIRDRRHGHSDDTLHPASPVSPYNPLYTGLHPGDLAPRQGGRARRSETESDMVDSDMTARSTPGSWGSSWGGIWGGGGDSYSGGGSSCSGGGGGGGCD